MTGVQTCALPISYRTYVIPPASVSASPSASPCFLSFSLNIIYSSLWVEDYYSLGVPVEGLYWHTATPSLKFLVRTKRPNAFSFHNGMSHTGAEAAARPSSRRTTSCLLPRGSSSATEGSGVPRREATAGAPSHIARNSSTQSSAAPHLRPSTSPRTTSLIAQTPSLHLP